MLYPTELSRGTCRNRTGGLRLSPLLYPTELTSLRGTTAPGPRHTPRQRRAHRAGHAWKACNLRRCEPFEVVPHWRLAKNANPCAMHPARRPCRSIKARRILAPARLSLPRASMPGCFGSAMRSRLIVWWIPLRTPETKRPRVLEPEGVRVASGDRGDRSPRWTKDQSMVVLKPRSFRGSAMRRSHARRPASRLGDGRLAAMWNACVMEVLNPKKSPQWRRPRTLRASFAFGNKFLTSLTSGMPGPAGGGKRKRPASLRASSFLSDAGRLT